MISQHETDCYIKQQQQKQKIKTVFVFLKQCFSGPFLITKLKKNHIKSKKTTKKTLVGNVKWTNLK